MARGFRHLRFFSGVNEALPHFVVKSSTPEKRPEMKRILQLALAAIALVPIGITVSCSSQDPLSSETGKVSTALTGDGTIPRVPNPPATADATSLAGDLRGRPVPLPPSADLSLYVKDQTALVQLGKALFWDMQVGADGIQACASCHFRAGADPRSKNQISPGLKHVPVADHSFKTGGPNFQLTPASFPLTKLAVPGTRGALDPVTDSNDVVSSQGVHFLKAGPDPDGFMVGPNKTRRVEPRNTPTVINAVFNHRQFWDGRAENVFNGVNHVGARDPNARVLKALTVDMDPVPTQVALVNSSLASQAVAPLTSDLEMSAPGGTLGDVARRLAQNPRRISKFLRSRRPLAKQQVHPQDSVLGGLSRFPYRGLTVESYDDMVKAAFQNVWWDSNRYVRVAEDGTISFTTTLPPGYLLDDVEDYSLLQYNFGLFFGLAVQAYEATLISDDTPWDRFRRQHPTSTDPMLNPWVNTSPDHISRLALFGAHLFNDRFRGATNIRCSNCHELAEFTDASVTRINATGGSGVRNRDGNVIDRGFNNIGVRPTSDDLGVGASDAFGALSLSKRRFPDGAPIGQVFDNAPVSKGFGLEGAFKVPGLRNVALTAPYFHNGDARTLREAVEFYSRGGSVFPVAERDGTPIEPLGVPTLTSDEVDAIVAFLESLTDDRVKFRRAPFDHPQLFVPNGHIGNQQVTLGLLGFSLDSFYELPAVGVNGGPQIPGFLEAPFN